MPSKKKSDTTHKNNIIARHRTISRDLVISLVLAVTIVSILTISLNYRVISGKAEQQNKQKAVEYLAYLQDSLELPLWNVDEEGVEKIVNSFIKNELVAKLKIKDSEGNVWFERLKNEPELLENSGKVTYEGQVVGHIEIGLTPRIYKENNLHLLISSITTLLFVVAVLIGVTGFLLRVFLIKPLDYLNNRIGRIANGDYEYKTKRYHQREIETIISKFNDMADRVQSREKSLSEINIKLKQEIDDRKEAEEALRESEDKFKTLTNNLNVGVYRSSADPEGTFIEANPAIVQMFGYDSREEFLGISVSDLYLNPDDRKEFVEKILKEGSVSNEELQLLKKDGMPFFGSASTVVVKDEKGKVRYFDGIVEDISERKQAEEALRESEEKYRLLVQYAPAGIFEFDMEDQRFISVNDVMCEYTGYTKEEFLALDPFELLPEESKKTLNKLLDEVFSGNQNPEPVEYKVRGKFDQEFWVLVNSNFFFEDGVPKRSTSVVHDITILKQAEEEKKRLEEHLRQAQKMESLGTLAGGIAHDFNNLLMGIQGHTSLMLINSDTSKFYYEHLKGIEDYVKSAADLTKQLLGFARGGKYEVKATDLNALIKNQNRMFGRTRKEITIRGKYEKNLWPAEVDQGQVEQVLLNIYVNAWQAMPGGGNLYVQTQNILIDEDYSRPYRVKPGRFIKVSITDTGVGMDEATRQKIFDPFFTTKEMERGTGLGLASAYGIIKNHAGFINVYSEKGKGTTFNIYLPASAKEAVKEKEFHEEVLRGTETVLIVDDEDMIVEIGQEFLKTFGYKVFVARSGKEALQIYKKKQDKIDIVVLDMIMPDMGGGETYDRLKEINPDIKVLLSSGYSIDGEATKILERGCNGFIQKPFNIVDLSKKIREILNKG